MEGGSSDAANALDASLLGLSRYLAWLEVPSEAAVAGLGDRLAERLAAGDALQRHRARSCSIPATSLLRA